MGKLLPVIVLGTITAAVLGGVMFVHLEQDRSRKVLYNC